MTQRTETYYLCDRCLHESKDNPTNYNQFYNWGKLFARPYTGNYSNAICSSNKIDNPVDLCSSCYSSLMNWYKNV